MKIKDKTLEQMLRAAIAGSVLGVGIGLSLNTTTSVYLAIPIVFGFSLGKCIGEKYPIYIPKDSRNSLLDNMYIHGTLTSTYAISILITEITQDLSKF